MGGIVKSIGKAVKKLGKSVGKFLKKYRTTIILAAAVWAGLGAFGASASTGSIWSAKSVAAGVDKIFSPAMTTAGQGWTSTPGVAGPLPYLQKETTGTVVKTLAKNVSTSKNVLSAISGWFKDIPEWGKYALTQTGMTIVGSMLDKSAEEEMAARYGSMGIPYGGGPEDPTAIYKEHPEWMAPPPPEWPMVPTTTSQASTPQQSSSARAQGVTMPARQQQIAAMRTSPLDVSPPGMLGGRRQGLINMSSNQRRYA